MFYSALLLPAECSREALLDVQPAQHVRGPLGEEDALVGDSDALQHLLAGPFINQQPVAQGPPADLTDKVFLTQSDLQ